MYLTDREIERLIAEEKPSLAKGDLLRSLKPDQVGASRSAAKTVPARDGGTFTVRIRQSTLDPYDFSVILSYAPNGSFEFILRRHNGPSHRHSNPIEKTGFAGVCHIHRATARYQERGSKAEHFAEATERFHDVATALACKLRTARRVLLPRPLIADLKTSIDSALAAEVELRELPHGAAQVYVPFYFPDGDGLVVHVRPAGDDRLEITDNGHTLLHLSYHTDVKRLHDGQRSALLESIRRRHGVDDRDGEFVLASTVATVGVDVFHFSQALLEISDIRNLDREVVRSTFRDDFATLINAHFPDAERDYIDSEHDPRGEYPVPFVLNGTPRPIAVFDVNSDERALEALVIARQMREWGHRMHVVAVEEQQEILTRKHVAWLSAVVDKQFPVLGGSEADVVSYLADQHELSRSLAGTDWRPDQERP